MGRYFFHVDYGGERSPDHEGTAFEDIAAARTAAVQFLGAMLMDEGDGFWAKPNIVVTVADQDGLVLWTVETVGLSSAAVARRR